MSVSRRISSCATSSIRRFRPSTASPTFPPIRNARSRRAAACVSTCWNLFFAPSATSSSDLPSEAGRSTPMGTSTPPTARTTRATSQSTSGTGATKSASIGATACIVVPWFIDTEHYKETRDWRPLAWYIHDHLPYSEMVFFAKNAAFNLTWRECKPRRKILQPRSAPQWAIDQGESRRSLGRPFPTLSRLSEAQQLRNRRNHPIIATRYASALGSCL